ncbi:hypothetical protein D3C87_2169780 [compost metagenome]
MINELKPLAPSSTTPFNFPSTGAGGVYVNALVADVVASLFDEVPGSDAVLSASPVVASV